MKLTVKQYRALTDRERNKRLEGTGIYLSEFNHFRENDSSPIPVDDVVKAINEKQDEEGQDEDEERI